MEKRAGRLEDQVLCVPQQHGPLHCSEQCSNVPRILPARSAPHDQINQNRMVSKKVQLCRGLWDSWFNEIR